MLFFLVESNAFVKTITIDTNKWIHSVFKMLYYSMLLSFSSFVVVALCEHTYQVITNSSELRDLPSACSFPFIDTRKSPIYEVFSLIIFIYNFGGANLHVALDGMFVLSSMKLKAHFQILQNMFRESDFSSGNQNINHIKNLIRYHKSIISATDLLNETFNEVIFIQISMSALNICFIMILVIRDPLTQLMQILPNFLYLISILIQLFVYCNGGSLITSESFKVSLAIQESEWYNLCPDDRKMLVIIMLRSQKPLYITSSIFIASMENFFKVKFFF